MAEYWITDDDIVDADGDIGEVNHEIVVEQRLLAELNYDLDEEGFSHESARITFAEKLDARGGGAWWGRTGTSNWDLFAEEMEAEHGEDWRANVMLDDYLRWLNLPDPALTEEAQQAETARIDGLIAGFSDPRKYAIQHWGWKRIEGHHIETWTLTQADCTEIADALSEIYGEESPEMAFTFHILGVGTGGRTLSCVPYADIESGKASKRVAFRPSEEIPAAAYRRFEAHPGD